MSLEAYDKIQKDETIDEKIKPLLLKLNLIKGVSTWASCQGAKISKPKEHNEFAYILFDELRFGRIKRVRNKIKGFYGDKVRLRRRTFGPKNLKHGEVWEDKTGQRWRKWHDYMLTSKDRKYNKDFIRVVKSCFEIAEREK